MNKEIIEADSVYNNIQNTAHSMAKLNLNPSNNNSDKKENTQISLHEKAQQYLEEKIDSLSTESFEKIIKVETLVDKVCHSANILIGLREALESLAQESELQDIKLVHFLESFYHSTPISKFYTEELLEENFKTAVLNSSTMLDKTELLGELYPNYFVDESGDH